MINRILSRAKDIGVSQAHICTQLGLGRTWLQSVKRYNLNIEPDRLETIANILNTTVEYLKGETDDPSPGNKKSPSEVDELLSDPEISAMLELYRSWSPSERRRATSLLKALKESE